MCSDQHVKYQMPCWFSLTSSLLLGYHIKQYIHTHFRVTMSLVGVIKVNRIYSLQSGRVAWCIPPCLLTQFQKWLILRIGFLVVYHSCSTQVALRRYIYEITSDWQPVCLSWTLPPKYFSLYFESVALSWKMLVHPKNVKFVVSAMCVLFNRHQ